MDECAQCRNHPFALCHVGERLIWKAALSTEAKPAATDSVTVPDLVVASLGQASEAGLQAVSDHHYRRTGERKPGNEILREALGM